jgi:hypothetical protein
LHQAFLPEQRDPEEVADEINTALQAYLRGSSDS